MDVNKDQRVETNAVIGDGPFVRTSNAVLREIAGEHLLVPVRRGNLLDAESLYILDDVGAWVWEALATPSTPAALAEGVRGTFEVAPGRDVEGDLRELLSDMVSQGLVDLGEGL